MAVNALAQGIKERIHFIARRMMAPIGDIVSHVGKRRAADFPNRDVAEFLLARTSLFDLLAGAVDRFVPGDALEAGQIAALDRLQQRILESIGCIQALTLCIAFHAGATLHLADGFVGFGAFATGHVARRSQSQQTAVFDVSLEHALAVAVNLVVGVDHLDAFVQDLGGLGADHFKIGLGESLCPGTERRYRRSCRSHLQKLTACCGKSRTARLFLFSHGFLPVGSQSAVRAFIWGVLKAARRMIQCCSLG